MLKTFSVAERGNSRKITVLFTLKYEVKIHSPLESFLMTKGLYLFVETSKIDRKKQRISAVKKDGFVFEKGYILYRNLRYKRMTYGDVRGGIVPAYSVFSKKAKSLVSL